tara:strand:+ start:270 stop:437 length:168 start_codon:yes stop_codon:yes gene_type:complete
MGVKKSERCQIEFSDNLEPSRCRNKAVEYFGGLDVCKNCYDALEEGYQKSLIELD